MQLDKDDLNIREYLHESMGGQVEKLFIDELPLLHMHNVEEFTNKMIEGMKFDKLEYSIEDVTIETSYVYSNSFRFFKESF